MRVIFHRTRKRRRSSFGKIFFLVAAVTLICYTATAIINAINPLMMAMAESKAKYIATQYINEAVSETMGSEKINYDDLVTLEKNSNGMVTALQANIIKINQIKSGISSSIQRKIANVYMVDIYVPLGNLFGNDLLSGKGPRVPIQMLPIGSVALDFANNFSEAGINQTKQEIFLKASVQMSVVLPTGRKNCVVETSIPITQTIIVGTVPNSYTNITDRGLSLSDKVLIPKAAR